MLAPIFDEAADKVAAEFPEPGQVIMGKVDCDREGMTLHVQHQITDIKLSYIVFNSVMVKGHVDCR
jgi:hypothetical protein